MSPLVYAGLLSGCVLLAAVGAAMLRSTPQGTEELLRDGDADGDGARSSPLQRLRQRVVDRYAPRLVDRLSDRRRHQLRTRIDRAGRPNGMTLAGYVERRLTAAITGALVGLALALLLAQPLLVPLLAAAGWWGFDLRMESRAKRRQARIERELADFLDVLAITVRTGMGFRAAMARVAHSLPGPVAEEVQTSLHQMALGASHRSALEGLRERNDSPGLDAFASSLLQAEELGSSLSSALQSIAADLRKTFAQTARQEAAKAAPKVTLVVVFLVLPGMVVLLVGTFALTIDLDLGMFSV